MARGFTWCVYVDDNSASWAVKVDADYALDLSRGWVAVDPRTLPQLPRGWIMRHVVGFDETGHGARASVATTSAALWTGVASTFVFNATDQLAHTATVVQLVAEHRLPNNPPETLEAASI